MRKLVIFGAGGFGQEAIWVAESMNEELPEPLRWEVLGYLDDDSTKVGQRFYGHPVLAAPPDDRDLWFHCALGSNTAREAVASRLEARGWRPAALIHPSVVQAKFVEVGEGTYVGAGSILSPNARVGRHVIVNQRVSVGHDSLMEDFSQACPGSQINGFCQVLRGALIGSGASIRQGRSVGPRAVVGANSLAVMDVEPGTTVLGVPARLLSRAE